SVERLWAGTDLSDWPECAALERWSDAGMRRLLGCLRSAPVPTLYAARGGGPGKEDDVALRSALSFRISHRSVAPDPSPIRPLGRSFHILHRLQERLAVKNAQQQSGLEGGGRAALDHASSQAPRGQGKAVACPAPGPRLQPRQRLES